MVDYSRQLEDAWLGIDVDESTLFNPMDFVMQDSDNDMLLKRLSWLMMKPEYFSFVCKYVLNIELSPFQALLLHEMWDRKFPMLIGSRGMGKSFILSVYPLLRALFMPRRKIIVVGAAFRQSKVLFEYMDTIWKNAPILRDLCASNSGPRRDVDRCVMHIGQSTVTCLPLGDGSKIRGQRANDIIADEFASIPRDIFENVVAGFAAVAASPIEKVKQMLSLVKFLAAQFLLISTGVNTLLLGYLLINCLTDLWIAGKSRELKRQSTPESTRWSMGLSLLLIVKAFLNVVFLSHVLRLLQSQ
jgi:hypothetical protein